MRLVLMCLAFIATVLLILSLYPSVTAKFIGSAESASGNPAEAREKMIRFSYPLIIFSVIFSGLLFLGINLLLTFIASLVCGILFYAAVARVLTAQKHKKSAIFEEHMLDFLVLVSNNLKSGFALPHAIDVSSRSIGGFLGSEFAVMMGEYRLGMELGEAVSRMNRRVKSENLQLFAATVSISVRTGSSISDVLDRLIITIHKRNEVADKLKAVTAQFNFEALLMSFFPLLIFIILYLIAPKLMSPMLTTLVGWISIGVILFLEVTGLFILKKICDIKI